MKGGDSFHDHARPMADVMAEISSALKEFAEFKRENPDYQTIREDYRALQEHIATMEQSGLLGWPSHES